MSRFSSYLVQLTADVFQRFSSGSQASLVTRFSRAESSSSHSFMSRQSVLAFLLVLLTTVFSVGNVWGEDQTATYTVSTISAVTTTGTAPQNSSATVDTNGELDSGRARLSGNKGQKHYTLTLSGYDGCTIKGLAVKLGSNSSKGNAALTFTGGNTTLATIASANLNANSWFGEWVSSGREKTVDLSSTSHVVGANENLVVTITNTANSAYVYYVSITYTPASSGDDPGSEEPALSSIQLLGTPTKTTYEQGEAFDHTGLTITGYYSVGDPQTISSGISWKVRTSEAANDAVALDEYVLTAGQTSVDVQATVGEISSDWVTISGLTVTAPEGDKLTRETTDVTGTSYADWEEVAGASGAEYAGNSAGGNESIQLRSDKSTSGIVSTATGGLIRKVKVAWNSNTASDRTLDVYGSNTAYTAASDLYGDNKGTLLGTIVNGTSTQLEITGDYEYVGVRSNSGAMYLESITFVWEAGKQLESIAIKTNPDKVNYNIGDAFDATGLVITATYDGSSPEDIAYAGNEDKFKITGFDSSEAIAEQAITVTYGGKSTTFNVEIKNVTLQSVTVDGTPSTASYTAGNTFDPAGLTVTGHYSDNSGAAITSGITWSYPDNDATLTAGQTSIRVVATVDEIASEPYTVNGLTVAAAPLVASWVASEQGYSDKTDMTEETVTFGPSNNFSIVFGAGTNSNAPKYYTSGEAVRAYGGNTFALSSTGYKFTQIVVTFASGDGTNTITTNVDTYSNGTWTGNSKEVVFTIDGTSGHRRIASITVTYEAALPSVETPTISPNGGDFITASQTVTITCATDGAEIHYTLDGTDPTGESATYTEALSLTGTKTVKAIAIKDGMENSAVASATFTKIEVKTVADALSASVGNEVYVSGTITSITEVSTTHGNATYVISDMEAGAPVNQMIIYRGKYLNNANFTFVDQLHVGDVVLVKGTISQQDSKNQLAAGNILQSISAPAVAAPSFTPDGGGFVVSASVSLACVTAGATIYYTTDGTTPDNTKNAYASAIPLTATTTIKAVAIKNSESSMVVERTFTKTDPMTVAAAYDALDSEDPISNAAVEGIVYKVDRCTANGNAQYWISDDGTESTKVIEIYNGYGLDGANFADANGIQVGDKVIVFGTLKIYYINSEEVCREFDSGSRLLSLTRKTVTGVAVTGTPSKTSYKTGQAFEPAGLTVTITYNDNSHATVAAADCVWEITPATFAEAGTNKSVSVKATYNNVQSPAFAVEGLTVTAAPTFNASDHEWQLVTSEAQLEAGKYYVIASTAQGKVMSNTISNSIAGEIAATFADGVIAYNAFGSSQSADAAGVAVLQLGGEADAWTLTEVVAEDALLGATAAKKIAWGSGTTTWSISIAISDATIQNGTSSNGRILHNVNDTRFTTYTSNTSVSMLLPQLYVWAEKVYKLRYDANGGENAPAAQPAVAGQATVTDAKPTKEDYIFKEWNTLVGGDGEAKAAGDVIDLSAGDVTLYAQWREPVTTVTISYDANEGSGSMAADADQVEGSTYTIKTNTFERNGYLFAGWKAYDTNDDELTITNGKFTVPATDVTVKAQWQSATDSKWVLVEHLSQLADGDKVIIAAKDYDYALSTTQNNNNRGRVEISKSGKLLIPNADVQQLTLGKDGSNYTFHTGEGYLYAASSSSNYLRTQETNDANGKWTITLAEGGVATITAQGTNTHNIMSYNSNNSLFSCYTTGSTLQDLVIYKYLDIDPENATSGYEREDLVLSGIGTICLPYDVKASDRFGGVFYMPSHKTSGFANFIEETGTLRAGKAYIFVAENEFIRLKYSGNEALAPLSEQEDTRGLIGTFTNIVAGNLTGKYVIADNKLRECGSGAYLNAYRAYLDLDVMPETAVEINDGPGAPARRRLGIGGGASGVTTDIEDVQGDSLSGIKVLLNGQLFIIRGEKMYDATGRLVK